MYTWIIFAVVVVEQKPNGNFLMLIRTWNGIAHRTCMLRMYLKTCFSCKFLPYAYIFNVSIFGSVISYFTANSSFFKFIAQFRALRIVFSSLLFYSLHSSCCKANRNFLELLARLRNAQTRAAADTWICWSFQ